MIFNLLFSPLLYYEHLNVVICIFVLNFRLVLLFCCLCVVPCNNIIDVALKVVIVIKTITLTSMMMMLMLMMIMMIIMKMLIKMMTLMIVAITKYAKSTRIDFANSLRDLVICMAGKYLVLVAVSIFAL